MPTISNAIYGETMDYIIALTPIVNGKRLLIEATEAEQASIVLLCHAHSAAQEANTMLKKAKRARQ